MSSFTMHVSNIQLGLEPVSAEEHALVLSDPDGDAEVRVVGTVAELRQAADYGLWLPIPSFRSPEPEQAPASSNGEVSNADVLAAINTLTDIANRIVTRFGY